MKKYFGCVISLYLIIIYFIQKPIYDFSDKLECFKDSYMIVDCAPNRWIQIAILVIIPVLMIVYGLTSWKKQKTISKVGLIVAIILTSYYFYFFYSYLKPPVLG